MYELTLVFKTPVTSNDMFLLRLNFLIATGDVYSNVEEKGTEVIFYHNDSTKLEKFANYLHNREWEKQQ